MDEKKGISKNGWLNAVGALRDTEEITMSGQTAKYLNRFPGTPKFTRSLPKKFSKRLKTIRQRIYNMEFEGKIFKDGKFWIAEIPALDAMTQGKTRKDALIMIKDFVLELTISYFGKRNILVSAIDYKNGLIGITLNDTKILAALALKRQREKSGLTIREASQHLGSKSPNAFAQYEKGKTSISIEKYEELLMAANPQEKRHLKVV